MHVYLVGALDVPFGGLDFSTPFHHLTAAKKWVFGRLIIIRIRTASRRQICVRCSVFLITLIRHVIWCQVRLRQWHAFSVTAPVHLHRDGKKAFKHSHVTGTSRRVSRTSIVTLVHIAYRSIHKIRTYRTYVLRKIQIAGSGRVGLASSSCSPRCVHNTRRSIVYYVRT